MRSWEECACEPSPLCGMAETRHLRSGTVRRTSLVRWFPDSQCRRRARSIKKSEFSKNVICFFAEKPHNGSGIHARFVDSVDLDNSKEDLYGREGYDQECTCWNDC